MEAKELVPIEGGENLDLSQYEGKRCKVESIEVKEMTTNYNEKGEWVEGLNKKVMKLRVITEVITKATIGGKEVEIRASELFPLKVDKDGKWGWGTKEHPKFGPSKVAKLLKKFKVNSPQELVGQFVTIRIRPDNSGRDWLGFIV